MNKLNLIGKFHKLGLSAFIIILCLCFVGCNFPIGTTTTTNNGGTTTDNGDDTTTVNNDGTTINNDDTTIINDDTTNIPPKEPEDNIPTEDDVDYSGEYYKATVKENFNVASKPYIADKTVPNELKGVYYSAMSPGGTPKKDGTGNIWLTLRPIQKYTVSQISIEGTYDSIENLGRDVYCIKGVASDIKISTKVENTPSLEEAIFASSGHGISDDGNLIIKWKESAQEPIRYIELSYTDGKTNRSNYIDASSGEVEVVKMTENTRYTVKMRAVGYKHVGKEIEFETCYMAKPKTISFPRVEITTQNYKWPTCDFVQSPPGCWGAGIANALYEQCVMTLYNENNEVVYDSSSQLTENEQYLGAKMKIRGNTSATYASNGKYPYKIKLNTKFDLLEPLIGRANDGKSYADKEWVLLNYGREAYRMVGDAIADAVGTEWSPDCCYVGLYVNGDYRGLYVLSETVKRGNGTDDAQWRVPVNTDGYLIECDAYWWNEDLYFNTPLTKNTPMYFTFKYPDTDTFDETSQSYIYIKDYMTRFEQALERDDDSYLDYIDLDSFVKWLLVSDYLCIKDGGGSNLYLYKEDSTDNTKLFMGPNWDFDSFMGDQNALATIRLHWDTAPFYYSRIVQKASFQARYKQLFNESYGKIITFVDNAFSNIDIDAHFELVKCDSTRYGSSNKTLLERKNEFKSWFEGHLNYMKNQFN